MFLSLYIHTWIHTRYTYMCTYIQYTKCTYAYIYIRTYIHTAFNGGSFPVTAETKVRVSATTLTVNWNCKNFWMLSKTDLHTHIHTYIHTYIRKNNYRTKNKQYFQPAPHDRLHNGWEVIVEDNYVRCFLRNYKHTYIHFDIHTYIHTLVLRLQEC